MKVIIDLIICKSKHFNTIGVQNLSALDILLSICRIKMLPAINFNH